MSIRVAESKLENVMDLVTSIGKKGAMLWVEEGELRYRARKGTLTATDIAALRMRRSEVISVLTRVSRDASAARGERPEEVLAPLTFQQQFLWDYIQRKCSWNQLLLWSAVRIRGVLDCQLLKRSFDDLVRRHGALHTQIVMVDGMPMQKVSEGGGFDLEVVELVDKADPHKEEGVRHRVAEFLDEITDPCAALFKARLLKLSGREHVLIMAVHHIISDGYTLILMFQELWGRYAELLQGAPVLARGLPAQYIDYAIWQRRKESLWREQQERYWKEYLAGGKPLELPLRGTGEVGRSGVGQLRVIIDDALVDAVRRVARRERTTPALVMFAAYISALVRWCGQRDFVVTLIASGRDKPEHEDMAGLFVYPLPIRVKLTGHETVRELLRGVRQVFHEALKHQEFAGASEKVVEASIGTTFNWVTGHPEAVSGLPTPDVLDCLRDILTLEIFPFRRNIDYVGNNIDNIVVMGFLDTGRTFEGTLSYGEARAAEICHLAERIKFFAREALSNPEGRCFDFSSSS